MLRMWARRKSQIIAATAADTMMFGMSLPGDTVIHDIKFNIEFLGANSSQELESIKAVGWAVETWIVPIDDPDQTADFNDTWDTMVPKDTDVQTMDLDTQGANTDVMYEPGEAEWQKVFDVGFRPEMLMHQHGTITINNTTGIVFIDSQTPFEPKWQPGGEMKYHTSKRHRVTQPSALLVAVGIPAFDDTVTVVESPLVEDEWGRVKYMADTVKMAMMDVIGLIETGAETPWEDATDLLQKHLEPDVFEQTSDFFSGTALVCQGEMIVDHSVVGELAIKSISTGR